MHVNRSTFLLAAALTFSTVAAELHHKRASDSSSNKSDNDTSECSSAIVSAYPALTNIPTPDSSLASFLAQQTQFSTYTDSCIIPAVTGSLAEDYTSWASKLQSWQSEYKDELSSVFDACSAVSGFQDGGGFPGGGFPGEVTGVCDSVTWESAGTAGQTAASATATATGAAASDAAASDSDNAAPRETGLGLAAVIAIAGLVVVGAL